MLEFIAENITDDQYIVSLRLFSTFKRTFNRVRKNYTQYNNEYLNDELNLLESHLHSFKGSSLKSPVNPVAKSNALDILIKIKQTIGNQYLVSGEKDHVAN
ncbi:hypothetical protein [Pectobacterium carotovorum]|nr:hypothetical protein [Pectobacterium carotovorum]